MLIVAAVAAAALFVGSVDCGVGYGVGCGGLFADVACFDGVDCHPGCRLGSGFCYGLF